MYNKIGKRLMGNNVVNKVYRYVVNFVLASFSLLCLGQHCSVEIYCKPHT